MADIGKITDRRAFAEHADPEAIRAHLNAARARASQAIRDVQWLEGLLFRPARPARLPHAHACVSCSPDGEQRGPGCHNCRETGMDQNPCQAEGHQPHCPAGCCDQTTAASGTAPTGGETT